MKIIFSPSIWPWKALSPPCFEICKVWLNIAEKAEERENNIMNADEEENQETWAHKDFIITYMVPRWFPQIIVVLLHFFSSSSFYFSILFFFSDFMSAFKLSHAYLFFFFFFLIGNIIAVLLKIRKGENFCLWGHVLEENRQVSMCRHPSSCLKKNL